MLLAILDERLSKTNQSTEKVLSIIELFSKNKEPMRIQDIAKKLEINASTVVRFLTTLMKCGYVSQNELTSRYYLTYKICSIAYRVSSQLRLGEIIHPYMQKLSKILNESVCLAIEQEMSVVYIDVVEGPDQMLRTMQRIGNVAPMHCTGVGKLLLLNYDSNKIDHIIAEKGMQKFTKNTIVNKLDLTMELQKVRLADYAFDNEECEIGARCVAAPIRDFTGKIIAAISVTGPIFRMDDKHCEQIISILVNSAKNISNKYGYSI
ncbi:MAG TPA: IclR family transcriptional regulator [Ruminiclostridium sp.]